MTITDALAWAHARMVDRWLTVRARYPDDVQGDRYSQMDAEAMDTLAAAVVDWHDDARRVLAEACAPDERHCACVPHLRNENAALKAHWSALEAWLRWLTTPEYVGWPVMVTVNAVLAQMRMLDAPGPHAPATTPTRSTQQANAKTASEVDRSEKGVSMGAPAARRRGRWSSRWWGWGSS